MKRRFGLQMKFTILFLGFMLLITAVVLTFTEYNNQTIIEDKYFNYAVSIAKLSAGMIEAEDIEDYKEQLETDERYEEILAQLKEIQSQTDIYYLYVISPILEEEGIYIFDVALEEGGVEIGGEETHALGDRVSLEDGFEEAKRVMETGEFSRQFEYDGSTEDKVEGLASAYAPIKDTTGTTIAFVGVDMNIQTIRESVNQAKNYMMGTMIALMAGCFILLMLIVRFSIIKPIKRLGVYAGKISEGTFGGELPVRGQDEISEITRVFNRMSKNIQGHVKEIENIIQGYETYVPMEFLPILGKDSITQMELGDHHNCLVTILAFHSTEAGKHMPKRDSRQILNDMNLLFRKTIPVIMEEHGFIEQLEDSGMLAIYKEGVEEAILSGITICQKMHRYSNWRGNIIPLYSMGIAYGNALFGNVGYEKRMETISISPHTSMARYLQKLAPLYGSHLLVTAGAVAQIENFQATYHFRFVGMVENKYSQTVEKIYDIYDGDVEEQRNGKTRTKESFERGVELYCMHRFRESRQAFIEVLKQFRTDTGAKRYLQLCNRYYRTEETENNSIYMSDEAMKTDS